MVHYSSRKWPIILGVILVALVVAMLVIWIVNQASSQQWGMLILGAIFFSLVLIGVVLYFILTIKEVNLSRRQANFIDAVTHELKSPIASIKLYLQTLDMREVDLEQQREFHRFMLEDVQRLDALIDHLLVAARLDFEEQEEAPRDVDAVECLTHCVDIVSRRFQLQPEQVEMDLVPCTVHARNRDLEMIFTNLLDNAAKYAGEHPKIHVQARPSGSDRVIIRISDNGRGVRFEVRRKIFQRFFRGGSELVRTTVGTGLGLYLVRSLVKKAKGKISVNNRGPLSGATFEVELPGRMIEEAQQPPTPDQPAENLTPQHSTETPPSPHS
ncbi:HAMP domain-containing sensor histidine kinase [Symmachiella dynata]|uniref:sensor histidine kinase n=1 Tax=Symmachiella dynata TaxID=2527995 RepID=UPI0030EDD766